MAAYRHHGGSVMSAAAASKQASSKNGADNSIKSVNMRLSVIRTANGNNGNGK